jgi:hypothetical protein
LSLSSSLSFGKQGHKSPAGWMRYLSLLWQWISNTIQRCQTRCFNTKFSLGEKVAGNLEYRSLGNFSRPWKRLISLERSKVKKIPWTKQSKVRKQVLVSFLLDNICYRTYQ